MRFSIQTPILGIKENRLLSLIATILLHGLRKSSRNEEHASLPIALALNTAVCEDSGTSMAATLIAICCALNVPDKQPIVIGIVTSTQFEAMVLNAEIQLLIFVFGIVIILIKFRIVLSYYKNYLLSICL